MTRLLCEVLLALNLCGLNDDTVGESALEPLKQNTHCVCQLYSVRVFLAVAIDLNLLEAQSGWAVESPYGVAPVSEVHDGRQRRLGGISGETRSKDSVP